MIMKGIIMIYIQRFFKRGALLLTFSLVAGSIGLNAADNEQPPAKEDNTQSNLESAELLVEACNVIEMLKVNLYVVREQNDWQVKLVESPASVKRFSLAQNMLKDSLGLKKSPLPNDHSPVIDYVAIKKNWLTKVMAKYDSNTLLKLAEIIKRKKSGGSLSEAERKDFVEVNNIFKKFIEDDVVMMGILFNWQYTSFLPDLREREDLATEIFASAKISSQLMSRFSIEKNGDELFLKIQGIEKRFPLVKPGELQSRKAVCELNEKEFIAKITSYFSEQPLKILRKLTKLLKAVPSNSDEKINNAKLFTKQFSQVVSDFLSYRFAYHLNLPDSDYVSWFIVEK